MKITSLLFSLVASFILSSNANAQSEPKPGPMVFGRGVGLFKIGPLIAEDNFDNLDDWVVQVEQRAEAPSGHVEAREGTLDCLVPGRGCTVWFKQKLQTRVTITYDVICPTPKPTIKGVQPRDINNFWMANDPSTPEEALFDADRYTGKFDTYDKMHGYYASTGGGRNTTTRMRRYPREVNGNPTEHLALTDKDGQRDFLITPDKIMSVQLVAYEDVIQYIVDGRLNYEIVHGATVQVERRNEEGQRVMEEAPYDLQLFPVYDEGYFGFRMVSTHHIYSNFRVHALEPVRSEVTVSSISELRNAVTESNQHVVMKPGTYTVTDLIDGRAGFQISGSNNHIDLSGVTIRMPISTLRQMTSRGRGGRGSYVLSGNHITLKGGTFENTYPDNKGRVTDFGSYNQDPNNYPSRGATEMRLRGNDITVTDCKFIVRGSYPYGYGNIYGIGEGAVVNLRKHCGIQVTGDRITIDRCELKMEAFGHAIYVQGGDQITVSNTVVEGEVRPSNDLYNETNDGDLAKEFGYKMQWPESVNGLPIPKDHMMNLTEDGIRAYKGTGHMTVENCTVIKARGGIKLYMAKSATISDCEVRDCVIQGYSLPSRGTLARSRGNAAYGPLLYVHMDSHSSQSIDLQVLPSPHGLGDHPFAAIRGKNHTIRLSASTTTTRDPLRPIIIGYPLRFDYLCVDYPKVPAGHEAHFAKFAPENYRASHITLDNRTAHPVILGELSRENKITSSGAVTDYGTDNTSATSNHE